MSLNLSSLTAKQKKVYYAIETFINQRGLPPTVREIGEMVGEKTPGAIQGILNRLEQKGVIQRETGMARSIKLIEDNSHYSKSVYIPEIKKITSRNINDILNIYNIIKYLPFPESLVDSETNHFVMACPDNSLMDSGIKYGDMLIISTDPHLNDGDVVLILYQNHVLLRCWYKAEQDDMVTLKADSDLIGKESFRSDEFILIGRLAGKFTSY